MQRSLSTYLSQRSNSNNLDLSGVTSSYQDFSLQDYTNNLSLIQTKTQMSRNSQSTKKLNTVLGIVIEYPNNKCTSKNLEFEEKSQLTDCEVKSYEDKENSHRSQEKLRNTSLDQFKTVQDFNRRHQNHELDFSFEYTNRDSLLKNNQNILNLQRKSSFSGLSRNHNPSYSKSFTQSSYSSAIHNQKKPFIKSTINQTLLQHLMCPTRSTAKHHQYSSSISSKDQQSTRLSQAPTNDVSTMRTYKNNQQNKSLIVTKGMQQSSKMMVSKQELMVQKTLEKRDLTLNITQLRKDIMHTQKQTKTQEHTNKHMQDDIQKLTTVVHQKQEKTNIIQKETLMLRKDCKNLERQRDELRDWNLEMSTELKAEQSLLDALSGLIINLKKQLHETKKDKEKFTVQNKSDQRTIECLEKRRNILQGDGDKLLMDFQETLQYQQSLE